MSDCTPFQPLSAKLLLDPGQPLLRDASPKLLLPPAPAPAPARPAARQLPPPVEPQPSPTPEPPAQAPEPAAPQAHPDRPPYLQHHFDTPQQQFSTAKLGMWIFLATEILMFGGLFCLYAVFRHLYPAAFAYGASFLDVGWGTINTVVLLLSSLTMALAVHCARTNQKQLLMLFLTLTMVCGIVFLGVKVIEYRHKIEGGMLWASSFEPRKPVYDAGPPSIPASGMLAAAPAGATAAAGAAAPEIDLGRARQLYTSSCAACHGPGGEGVARIGLPLRGSEFVGGSSHASMLQFLKEGRQANAPDSRMNAPMPARGGNPFLTDEELGLITAYVLSLNGDSAPVASADGPARMPTRQEVEATVPRWILTPPPPTNTGISPRFLAASPQPVAPLPKPGDPPPHAAKYFSLYFLMTGLHGVHLVVGLGVVGWLLLRASRWQFTPAYNTPVEVGGLYWHLVDVIWIFLFPLLYLVH